MRKAVTTAIATLSVLAASDASAAKRPATALEPQFVSLSEITTPIFGESRIEGALSVTLVLEASSVEAAGALRAKMPELRATALTAALEFSRLYASGYTPVDAGRLSADLNAAMKRAHPGIARVLIVRLDAVPA